MANGTLIAVKSIVVKPTYACDQLCIMCPHPVGGRRGSTMSAQEVDENLRLAAEMYAPRRVEIVGGEPLVHRDLPAIVASCMEAFPGVPLHVYTNGCHLDDAPVVDALARPAVVVDVSVHAPDEETSQAVTGRRGRHARLLRGLGRSAAAGLRMRAHVAVIRQNEHRLQEIAELIGTFPFESVSFRLAVLAAEPTAAYKPDAGLFVARVEAAIDRLPPEMGRQIIMAPLCFAGGLEVSDEPGEVVLVDHQNQLDAHRRRGRYENAIIDGFGQSRFVKPVQSCGQCPVRSACGGIDRDYLADLGGAHALRPAVRRAS